MRNTLLIINFHYRYHTFFNVFVLLVVYYIKIMKIILIKSIINIKKVIIIEYSFKSIDIYKSILVIILII